jgi:aspartyl-tRNA(Asn)/glutamyl-tRNA(Gln) amidotransferase subunit A
MPEWLEMLDPLVSQRILGGASMSATEYLKRRRHINQLQLSANARFESNDVIVSPTVPITPPKLDDVQQVDRYRPLNLMSLRNTCSGNTLGLCSLTLPVGLDTAGLPVGLQIMARHGAEEKLLAIALCIEKVIGTSKDRLGTPAIPPL